MKQFLTLVSRAASIILAIASTGNSQAPLENSQLAEIVVSSEKKTLAPQKNSSVEKVEVLKKERIDQTNANNLNEAVDRMQGIDSQDYCVNCGAKRISINGLRGDHTSVHIDGIPLFSAVTSVYGFDAIPMQSVEEIEVRRGTGSALLSPEAIGGSINILTVHPKETKTRASLLLGDHNSQIYELSHDHVLESYKMSAGVEHSQQEFWDIDKNGFAESPFKQRTSAYLKQILTLSSDSQWETRLGFSDMEIIGGNTSRLRLNRAIPIQASDTDFENGDVRKKYLGDPEKISEYIRVKRSEATSKLTTIVNDSNSYEWNVAGAIYDQESYYMHGFDYSTVDTTLYTDFRWNHSLTNTQGLQLGFSYRYEYLRSQSQVMYENNNIPKDDFDYYAHSIFAQHDWTLPFGLEVSTALRLENLQSKWIELGKIKRDVASPRILLKWQQTEHLSQQLAYGQGYRMPLTSIESAHGAYDGFIVDIKELEKSHSLLYSISYNTPDYYIKPSIHFTQIENMSYPLDPEVPHSGPLRFVNDTESHDIYVYDLLMGVRPTAQWLLEAGYENFQYPNQYKNKLPTAALENRISLRSEYENNSYTFIINGSWVGRRDLSQYYQYSNQYNVSDGLLGVSDPKRLKAPEYWQWDASLTKKINFYELTLGVQNIFDFTQTGLNDSPAMWHFHGSHTHLDNRHVWGPNRGREIYIKWVAKF
ncbi:MAG: TonB-dependent receptor plug domain-containing protein [Bdellovibrionales bacterium]